MKKGCVGIRSELGPSAKWEQVGGGGHWVGLSEGKGMFKVRVMAFVYLFEKSVTDKSLVSTIAASAVRVVGVDVDVVDVV